MGVLWQLLSASTPFLLCGIAVLILQQQLSYLKKKGPLPGPTLIIPFLGSAISMVSSPVRFWERQAAMAASSGLGFSANFIAGRFVIFLRSSELSHHVFANVRPDAFHLIGHPFGKKLFGERNMIYLFDEEHKELRRSIAPNFAPRALSAYLQIQQRVILRHLRSWIEIADSRKSAVPLRLLCRDLNLDTSQTVFVGPYLSAAARERFNYDYGIFNRGLLAFPLDLPGFTFRRARLAAGRLAKELAVCVGRSKARMRAGEEPGCLVDFWMSEAVRESPEKDSDGEIASHVFDFLFAAQDASTSSLLWAIALLESHPDVLKRVRREVGLLWSPESGELIGTEAVREMKYTEAVVREVIRIRPPATLVPHVAGEDFRLTEWYTVPKGAIVFPSVFESSFQGFPEPDRFDPDRFLGERQEDRVYKRNYLAFGAGPHQCVGQRYAVNHLVIFIALFVSLIDFRRRRTDGCDEIAYVPTIVPKDDCTVYLTRRRPGFSFPPF